MDKFIIKALLITKCESHRAGFLQPCFEIHAHTSNKVLRGICNNRAMDAGYFGRISRHAMKAGR